MVLEPVFVSQPSLGSTKSGGVEELIKQDDDVVEHRCQVPQENGSVIPTDASLQTQTRQRHVFVYPVDMPHVVFVLIHHYWS